MWELVYNEKEQEWFIKEFTRAFQLDDSDNFFHFYEDAEQAMKRRNSPPSNGLFWADGDERL